MSAKCRPRTLLPLLFLLAATVARYSIPSNTAYKSHGALALRQASEPKMGQQVLEYLNPDYRGQSRQTFFEKADSNFASLPLRSASVSFVLQTGTPSSAEYVGNGSSSKTANGQEVPYILTKDLR